MLSAVRLEALLVLDLSCCRNLTDIGEARRCGQLTELSLRECRTLEDVVRRPRAPHPRRAPHAAHALALVTAPRPRRPRRAAAVRAGALCEPAQPQHERMPQPVEHPRRGRLPAAREGALQSLVILEGREGNPL